MKIKLMIITLVLLPLGSHAAEDEFNLKFNMLKLNAKLGQAREELIRNEKASALQSFGVLKKEVEELLSNQSKIEALLPEGKKEKSSIAVKTAKRIVENIEIIEDAFGENRRKLSDLKRQVAAQRAYTSVEIACFHCHNLVRDQQ